MSGMICDVDFFPDHFCHAIQRPERRRKSVLLSSFQKQAVDLLELLLGDLLPGSAPAFRFETLFLVFRPRLTPFPGGYDTNLEMPRHPRITLTVIKILPGFETPAFERFGSFAYGEIHAYSLAYFNLMCEGQ